MVRGREILFVAVCRNKVLRLELHNGRGRRAERHRVSYLDYVSVSPGNFQVTRPRFIIES